MGVQSYEQLPILAAHPTAREFVDQLEAWGFVQRGEQGPHRIYRGPHGGTIRVVRSLYGRADTAVAEKAARLAGITVDRFWAGPGGGDLRPNEGPASTDSAVARSAPRSSARPVATPAPRSTSRPSTAARDRITSLVLAAHTAADRPLGFEQIVQACGDRITRAQVRAASAVLCRDGDLHRIRSGVYQWSGGTRATRATVPQLPVPALPADPALAAGDTPAAHLFSQLFPHGVQMTAELLADLEHWTRLTEKLVDHAQAF